MLNIIRRIVLEMNASDSFREALQVMVSCIRKAMETQACTVFLIDPEKNEYILAATDGLNPNAVGKIRLKMDQGIVGLVGLREEPINLEDAPSHPSFAHHPDVGEEQYRAYLGVPIIHQRELQGVLLVQQEQRRCFDESEEAFLVTMSAQLSAVIAHARTTGEFESLLNPSKSQLSFSFEGIAGAPGVAIGSAIVIYPPADLDTVPDRHTENIEEEITRFENALEATRNDIRALNAKLANNLSVQERALFDAYLQILDPEGLGNEVIEEIKKGHWAQGALRTVIARHYKHFDALEDDYLRERATDIEDLGRRVLAYLQARSPLEIAYPASTILAAEEITAAMLADVPEGQLAGIVSVRGSSNSHAAILARALNIPAVMDIKNVSLPHLDGREIILDGYHGLVHVSPSAEIREESLMLLKRQRDVDADLESLRELPAVSLDGHRISMQVNIGLAADAGISLIAGAEGVGLYRTEVPFMTRDRFPSEEEQRIVYRQLLQVFSPRPVTMRTLDVGGDKALPYFPVKEDNPFLGWRGIRITLDHPEVFLMQVRAMLQASENFDNLKIMLPMISSVSELDEAIVLIHQAYDEVVEEGSQIRMPQVGAMIEIPSAVYQADLLAQRADFLSVGTNDLTQYLLAVDRNNARVANLYDALHPSVLRALIQIVTHARHARKPLSICGEMAGDPAAVILLMGMGYEILSLNAAGISRIKWVIRNFTLKKSREILDKALTMEDPGSIRRYLEQMLQKAGLGVLIQD